MEKDKIELGFGSEIFNLLSSNFYKNKDMIFEELIVNSLDAGATKIKIKFYRNGSNIYKIEIEDNGYGISEDEIINTIYIAKSSKKLHNRNVKIVGKEKYRPIRGLFGLGKISTREICDKIIIESWNKESKKRIEFDYSKAEEEENVSNYKIPVTRDSNDKNSYSGTKVISEKVNSITEDELYSENDTHESIFNRLRKNIPFDDSIEIIFDEKVLTPYNFEDEEDLFYLAEDKNLPYLPIEKKLSVGNLIVTGKLYIVNQNIKPEKNNYGVFIKVKDRVVNKGDTLNIIELNSFTHNTAINKRAFIYLNVDFLEKEIMANRSGFKNNTGFYPKFQSEMKEYLNQIWVKAYERLHNRYTKRNNWWHTQEEIKKLDEKVKEVELEKRKVEEEKRKAEEEKIKEENFNNLFSFIESLKDKNKLENTFPFLKTNNYKSEKEKLKKIFQETSLFEKNLETFFRENFELIKNKKYGDHFNELLRFTRIQFYLEEDRNRWSKDKANLVYNFETHYLKFKKTDNIEFGYLKKRNFPQELKKTTYYEDLIEEINLCIEKERYTGATILSRKLFENFIIDFYYKYFPTRPNLIKNGNKQKTYNQFNNLINNLDNIAKNNELQLDIRQIETMLGYLKEFLIDANSNTHHLVILCLDRIEFNSFKINKIYDIIIELWNKQKIQT